jgi:hypothetical protein
MKQQLSTKNVPYSSGHIWVMSLIVVMLMALAFASATRLPDFLATGDVVRVVGTVVFNLIALLGVIDNLHTHVLFWQNQPANQPEIVVQN